MGFVLYVSVLCVFFSTMESSIPNVPCSLESIRIPSPAWREFNHDESQSEPECRSFFFFLVIVPLRREYREGEREQKVKNSKTRVTPTKQEKAPEPPENRDSRRNSNASRVGGGVHIHAYTVIVYTHYDLNALIPPPRPTSRRVTLNGAARDTTIDFISLSLAPPPSPSLLLSFSSSAAERRGCCCCIVRREEKTLKEDPRSRAQMSARP